MTGPTARVGLPAVIRASFVEGEKRKGWRRENQSRLAQLCADTTPSIPGDHRPSFLRTPLSTPL